MKKTILTIALLLLSLSVISGTAAQTAYAQTVDSTTGSGPAEYTLLAPLPGLGAQAGTTQTKVAIQQYLIYIFKLAIAVAVFLAVVMITWGGFRYMTVESITGKSDARQIISNALWGLLGALGSWLILYTINPQLVDISLVTVPSLKLQAKPDALANFQKNLAAQNSSLNATITNNAINLSAAAGIAQQTAQSNIDSANTQLINNDCLDNNGDYIGQGIPACDTAESQYQAATNALTTAISQQSTQKAVVDITQQQKNFEASHAVFNCAGCGPDTVGYDTNIDDAKQAIQNIDTIYNQTWSALANTDASDKALLTAQRTYAEATIVNDYNTNVMLQKLNDDLTKTSQPAIDIASANSLIKQLQSYSIPNQTNSNGIIANPVGNLTSQPSLQTSYQQLNDARVQALQGAITKLKNSKT